jgi:hypothetical protein
MKIDATAEKMTAGEKRYYPGSKPVHPHQRRSGGLLEASRRLFLGVERGGVTSILRHIEALLRQIEEYFLSSTHKNWVARRRAPCSRVRAVAHAVNGAGGVP